jgi:hypothetical protein
VIVHILRSPEYSKNEFNSIIELLNIKSKFIKIKAYSNEIINYKTSIEIKDWGEFFEICKDWRKAKKVSNDDYVFLLTNHGNKDDYFSWTDEKLGDYFIHSPELGKYFNNPKNQHFATVYEIITCILISLMYDTQEEILNAAHQKARGCPLDFCDDKEDIVLKIRTGDVCYDCLSRIKDRGVNPLFLGVIFNKMEEIRKALIFREREDLIEFNSPLRIIYGKNDSKIEFTELPGVTMNFDDLQTTIYCLILKNKSIGVQSFLTVEDEFRRLYILIKNIDLTAKEIANSIKTWTNPDNSEIIIQNVSKMNTKLNTLLGKNLASNYLIKNNKGKYSIGLNKSLFTEFYLNKL